MPVPYPYQRTGPQECLIRRVAVAQKNQRVPEVTRDNEEMHRHGNFLNTSAERTLDMAPNTIKRLHFIPT